jgi:hypothetical protein
MKISRTLMPGLIFLLGLFATLLKSNNNVDKVLINPSRIFTNIRFSSIEKIVKYQDKYFVLEEVNHRVLVFNSSEEFLYQISSIGQEKEDLFYPSDFVIKAGHLYIQDYENSRIQIFDLEGNYMNTIRNDYNFYGMGVNSRGEIYIGQPEKGKLVSVYDINSKLLRTFGELRKISYFYGPDLKDLDKKSALSINRVNMCLDSSDNLYLSFVGAPFFQKYDKDGNLIFEKKILGPGAEEIINEFRNKRKSPVRRTINNEITPLITTGIAFDEASSSIVITFQWNRSWVYVANSEGEKTMILEPTQVDMLFQNISSDNNFNIILPRLSTIKYNEAYSISLKNFLKGGEKL